MIFSYSRLKLYDQCPAAFSYKYLLELLESPSEPLVLGKAVHAAIEKYLNGDDMESAVKIAIDAAELPLDREAVQSLAGHPAVQSIMGGVVEQHFCLPLSEEGNIILQGYIDWWKDDASGIVLKDWKTNRMPYQPTNNHQLGLYAWALGELTGANEVLGELVFLRFPYSAAWYKHTYTQQDMTEARQWALNLALEIEAKLAQSNADIFIEKPGAHCQHCSYASLCIRSVKVEPIIIEDMPAATKVATEVIRLEAALSDYKDKLKSWVKAEGDVHVDDTVFTFVPSNSWQFEKLRELCCELETRGIDYWPFLSLTAAQVKKTGLNDEEIKKFGTRKETQTFRHIKAG